MRLALTRALSPAIVHCELTHFERVPIDFRRAVEQHAAYEAALTAAGCTVQHLEATPELADGVFVEDTAVVLDEVAVLTRPGAASRQGEVPSTARALRPLRPLVTIEAPGTLDGGDVLRVGRTIYVGSSGRTNPDGIAQLERHLAPLGYRVRALPVSGCLHLKTAVTQVGERTLLLNPAFVDRAHFEGMELIAVDPLEPFAANALRLGETVIYPLAYGRTAARLEAHGIRLSRVEVSELAKAEAGVTCCSLLVER